MTLKYYTAAQTRELDRLAIEKYHIPGFELMSRAGLAAWNALQKQWPSTKNLLIFCGTGNNGGDGFIIASLAMKAGKKVKVYLAGDPIKIKGDAKTAYEQAISANVLVIPAIEFEEDLENIDPETSVIVDALLGTGLKGPVREPFSHLINLINASPAPVLAVDIPSGLCSDSGQILGCAVRAQLTVTFIGQKLGQVRNQGPACCGELVFDKLNVPDAVYSEIDQTLL